MPGEGVLDKAASVDVTMRTVPNTGRALARALYVHVPASEGATSRPSRRKEQP